MGSIATFILLLLGLILYFIRPKMFFIYWLSIQPYILPVFFILSPSSFTPVEDNFLPLYFGYPVSLGNLMLVLFIVALLRVKGHVDNLKILVPPIMVMIVFLFFQSIWIGFNISALYTNYRWLLFSIAPFILLYIDKRTRPHRYSLLKFIHFFIIVQSIFCVLNLLGYRIYGDISGIFDDNLVCGTFTRYNHMANYLATFYLIVTYEFYEGKLIKRKNYLFMTIFIGGLILISGSRMNLILYTFIFLFFFFINHRVKYSILIFIAFFSAFCVYFIGNRSYSGQSGDEGTGFERNIIGITNLSNADDISEGNTLALSAYLLADKFESPLIGNGQAFRKNSYYDVTDEINEDAFKTDARLVFMLVEYGIIGLLLFLFIYFVIFKGTYMYSYEHKRRLYLCAFIYFLLFSLTDNGFWDYTQFSIVLIYAFSIKMNEKRNIIVSTLNS